MKIKAIFSSLYRRACDYNLFIPDENDYDDEPQDPTIALKHQKYTTRLYLLLLIVCMYILFYTTMMKLQARTVVISNMDEYKFEKLYVEHGELLSCPCSTITTLYKTFVSHTIRFHPVCSSFFTSQQWIDVLYISNKHLYGVGDFRKTASSQFQLLTSLCSFYQDITLKNKIDLDTNELVTIYLIPKSKIQSEIDATIEFFKSSLSTRIISFIDYLRIVTQTNNFITALNSNAVITYRLTDNIIQTLASFVSYIPTTDPNQPTEMLPCGIVHSTSLAALYSVANTSIIIPNYWINPATNSTLVLGFFTSCSPFEALLKSTLDCLYEIECLRLLAQFFPFLQQMNLNFTDYILHSNKTNRTVYDHLSNLFIDEWTVEMNYSAYFHSCNPSICTYTATDTINYSYTITLFISLYGGLILILRSISSFSINILIKLKCQSINRISLASWKIYLQKLNLFKIADKRTENDVKQQKLTTRVYLILLLIVITVLLLFNSLSTQTITKNVSNPTLTIYIDLQKSYLHTLRCPCSTMAIPYQKFMSLSPVLHQICSSDFTTDKWLSILKQSATSSVGIDWRNRAYPQFNLLSKICQLANETVTNAINGFLLQSFVVSNALTGNDFQIQIEKILVELYQSLIVYFSHLIHAVDLHIQTDEPFMIKYVESNMINTTDYIQVMQTITINDKQFAELSIISNRVHDIYSKLVVCFCSTAPHCQTSSAIFYVDLAHYYTASTNFSVSYVVPGSIVGCSEVDSLLLSTFECFYSDSACFSILMDYIEKTYIWNVEDPLWFDVHPLIYNSTTTRFYRNDSISKIINSIMIEQWNPLYSYETFYQLCSPNYCLYSEKIRSNNAIGLAVILMSMIGGVIVSLRLITPYLSTFLIQLISIRIRRQQQIVAQNRSQQLNLAKQRIIQSIHDVLINLNIFPQRDFGGHIDRIAAKHLGIRTTRFYIISLVFIFIILTFYASTQQHIVTKDFSHPSFNTYHQLVENYGDEQLQCSCSSIASIYRKFVTIRPIFHEICSSVFASDEMINNLTVSLPSNMSIYEKRDYRRLISSHIQYLTELCHISFESVNNAIEQFLSTLFITKELIIEDDFNEHINSLIKETKLNAPNTLNSIFFLIRNINFGNALISTYGTSYTYIALYNNISTDSGYLDTKAEIYDNDCSCGLQLNCTSQAYFFIGTNSSDKILLKGLKIGCTSSESFLLSTLECFYENSCVDSIKKYTNYFYSLESLPIINESKLNTTVGELVQSLFIDEWITTKNYSSYYEQCSPSICSYSYTQKFNLIYLISFLLGLQGGLSIVLKWICPKTVQFIIRIKQKYRNKRLNIIQPKPILSIITTDGDNRNMLLSHPMNSRQNLLKIIFIRILITILTIAAIVIFSVYIARRGNQVVRTISSTTITTFSATVTSSSMSTTILRESVCQLRFERLSIYISESYPTSTFVGDLNNDHRLDIGYVTIRSTNDFNTDNELFILLGNGDGTFQAPIISVIGQFRSLISLATADFNNDNLLDIVLAGIGASSLYIYYGNGDGTFGQRNELFVRDYNSLVDMSVADFNNDSYFDIAIAYRSSYIVSVFFGNGNETFVEKIMLATEQQNSPVSIIVHDFNGDDFADIAIIDSIYRNARVFLGHGNGSFNMEETSFTGGRVSAMYIAIGDFNEDIKEDIVVSYQSATAIAVMFGYGNGTFGNKIKLRTSDDSTLTSPVVSDFNGDGHLDIAIVGYYSYTIDIYFGNGNGMFEIYRMFSLEYDIWINHLIIGDLNGDGYKDIITTYEFGVDIFLNTGQCNNASDIIETSTLIQ